MADLNEQIRDAINKENREKFFREEQERQRRQQIEHSNKIREAEQSKRSSSSSSTSISSSNSVVYPAKPLNKKLVLVIVLVLIVGGLFGIRYWNYSSSEGGLYHHYEITETLSGNSTDFVSSINDRDNNCAMWELSVAEKPDGYFFNIFAFSDKSAKVEHWSENGNEVFFYEFEGYDMGTGLNGRYYLTTIDGKLSIIDKSEKTIYPQGTKFFDEHYEALSAFTYDAIITKLTGKLTGGEYGRNKNFNTTILKTDKTSACVYDERYETRILDERGDVRLYYTASFSDTVSNKLPDISTYKTAEK